MNQEAKQWVDLAKRLWSKIEDKLDYQEWYCGHFHIEEKLDKMHFKYESIGMF